MLICVAGEVRRILEELGEGKPIIKIDCNKKIYLQLKDLGSLRFLSQTRLQFLLGRKKQTG